MFKTFMGPVEEDAALTYLRPETAQGIFVNFDNVLQSMRKKLPFGIGQIGKSFRNEITPGNFIFRTREFEQMEIEYFVNPGDVVEGRPADEYWHERWIADCMDFFGRYGLRPENLRLREHEKDELAHYAKRTVDVDYRFPIGWSELMGIANRTDFDLRQHSKGSGKSLTYFDEEKKEHVVPYVIEPAAGVDRMLLAFLVEAYREEEVRGEKRVVLRFHPELAPVSVAVLPLLKKREEIVRTAQALRDDLARYWTAHYDDTAAIGRLYRRQDEIGTAYCVTVDVQTVGDSGKGERRRRQGDHPRSRFHGAGSRADTRAGSCAEGSPRGGRLDGRRWSIWRRAGPSGLVARAARRAAKCGGRHGLCACGRAGSEGLVGAGILGDGRAGTVALGAAAVGIGAGVTGCGVGGVGPTAEAACP